MGRRDRVTPADVTEYRDGMSFDAIGRALGISHDKARDIYERAMRKLRHNQRVRRMLQT